MKDETEDTKLWQIEEVAAFLNITRRRVLTLLNEGLPHICLGKGGSRRQLRFNPKSVRKWLETRDPGKK